MKKQIIFVYLEKRCFFYSVTMCNMNHAICDLFKFIETDERIFLNARSRLHKANEQTSSVIKIFRDPRAHIMTRFCLFGLSVYLCLSETNWPAEEGWSFHQHYVCGGIKTLWPSTELSGGLQRPPHRSEVRIHAHHIQCAALPTAQREDSNQRLLIWARV